MALAIAIVLGFVQGLTEFLPVSSSGHLVIVGHFFSSEIDRFKFDILLNVGSLAALIWYCRLQLKTLFSNLFNRRQFDVATKLALGTLPAAVFGLLLTDQIAQLGDQVLVVVSMLTLVGGLMVVTAPGRPTQPPPGQLPTISYPQAALIGVAQALALIPGTSRAAITILVGLWLGLSLTSAVHWSFLLAIFIITGALVRVVFSWEGLEFIVGNWSAVLVGNIISFIAALIAIKYLLDILNRSGLRPFGWYRLGLGVVLIGLLVFGLI